MPPIRQTSATFRAASWPFLENLDLWIIDGLRYTGHPSHFSVNDALSWIDRFKPRRAVITNMHSDLDYEVLRQSLPPNVVPAYDGMRLTLDRRGLTDWTFPASYFVQFQRGWMEQFFRRQQSGRQPLGVVTLEETGQDVAVRLQSVRPEILAHQRGGPRATAPRQMATSPWWRKYRRASTSRSPWSDRRP